MRRRGRSASSLRPRVELVEVREVTRRLALERDAVDRRAPRRSAARTAAMPARCRTRRRAVRSIVHGSRPRAARPSERSTTSPAVGHAAIAAQSAGRRAPASSSAPNAMRACGSPVCLRARMLASRTESVRTMAGEFLSQILVLLAGSLLVLSLVRRFALPPILGYLRRRHAARAACARPRGRTTRPIRLLAEIGVVFLVFTLGLEFSLGAHGRDEVRGARHRRPADAALRRGAFGGARVGVRRRAGGRRS